MGNGREGPRMVIQEREETRSRRLRREGSTQASSKWQRTSQDWICQGPFAATLRLPYHQLAEVTHVEREGDWVKKVTKLAGNV